jgi:hypothetical protein
MESADTKSPDLSYRMVDYNDKETKIKLQQQLHQQMAAAGQSVRISQEELGALSEYYPDLRSMKKKERTPILKAKRQQIMSYLKHLLHQQFDGRDIEFSIDGNVIEARLYSEGIDHVVGRMDQQKAAMLQKSGEIFSKAQYLFSAPNDVHGTASSNDQIQQWNYFYVPLEFVDSNETLGIRVAVKKMARSEYQHIYDLNMKKNSVLAPGDRPKMADNTQISSSYAVPSPTVSQNSANVNTRLPGADIVPQAYRNFDPFAEGFDSTEPSPIDPDTDLSLEDAFLDSLDGTEKSGYDESEDKSQFESYKALLGKNAPAKFSDFQALKYGDEWPAFKAYANAIESGELSPLADFELYQSKSVEIDQKLVGVFLPNGLEVSGKSDHYIARTIGSVSQRRNGVDVPEALRTLTKPIKVDPVVVNANGKSQRFIGAGSSVSINPDTGTLIQVNPLKIKKAKETIK